MIHKRFMNMQTEQQTLYDIGVRRFAEWVDSAGKPGEYVCGTDG